MKGYIHARLTREDRMVLEALKKLTGHSESELVRRGIRMVRDEMKKKPSALELAGSSVGKFRKGKKDLPTNPKHMDGFGE